MVGICYLKTVGRTSDRKFFITLNIKPTAVALFIQVRLGEHCYDDQVLRCIRGSISNEV